MNVFSASNRVGIYNITNTELKVISDELTSHKSAGSTTAHVIANITGLQTILDNTASGTHTHLISNVTGLQAALDAKAATSHTQAIATITGLQGVLDGKEPSITGFTGTSSVVTSVDFAGSSVTTATLNITNGIITSIT